MHEIFRAKKDTIENIYGGFRGNRPQTYDSYYGIAINEPYEFPITIADVNHDGYNDVIFSGKIKYVKPENDRVQKILPVKFIFLYDKAKKKFIEKEDYSKKFEFIYGDTIH